MGKSISAGISEESSREVGLVGRRVYLFYNLFYNEAGVCDYRSLECVLSIEIQIRRCSLCIDAKTLVVIVCKV